MAESTDKEMKAASKLNWIVRYFPWALRIFVFLGVVFLAWPRSDASAVAGVLPQVSPWLALCRIAGRSISITMIVPGILLLLMLFIPRVYCRYVCPVGFCYDLINLKRKPWKRIAKFPNIGAWIVGIGIGASAVGYPLLLWIDPLVMANAGISAFREGPLTPIEWVAALAGPIFLLVVNLLFPSLWRVKLCPVGALQDLVYRFSRWIRHPFSSNQNRGQTNGNRISRRFWLGLGLAGAYRLIVPPKASADTEDRPIRPPATPSEEIFLRKCARCGACARACPNGIIKYGGLGKGLVSILAPELNFEENFCHPECTACSKVCPTGAIPAFNLYNKFEHPIGLAVVNKDLCQLTASRECGFCINSCPHGALDLDWDAKEMISTVVIKPDVCVGCGACAYSCPVSPKAIRIIARKEFPHEEKR